MMSHIFCCHHYKHTRTAQAQANKYTQASAAAFIFKSVSMCALQYKIIRYTRTRTHTFVRYPYSSFGRVCSLSPSRFGSHSYKTFTWCVCVCAFFRLCPSAARFAFRTTLPHTIAVVIADICVLSSHKRPLAQRKYKVRSQQPHTIEREW